MEGNRSFRVLQLGKFFPIGGGVEKVMYDLMAGLSERGVDCDMMAATVDSRGYVQQVNDHARIICCHTWVKHCATTISPSMISTLRKECKNYDIIHVHHPDPMACIALRLSGYKGKVVLHWHSDILKQQQLLKLYRPLQNWLIRRADLIIGTTPLYLAGSPYLKDVQEKTACLPIGVSPILPKPEDVKEIQQQYGGKKIVFSLGRLVDYKGYKHLIDAASYLSDDYIVLIGGGGPLMNELDSQIKKSGLEKKVILLGRVPDDRVAAYFGASKIFCLSSVQKTEAFAIVQIEAMSCGKPVVATNIPESGVPWVNAHGVSGLNVEPGNAKEIAEAITAIAGNQEVYEEYSQRALQRYNEVFTKDEMINSILDLYCNL